MSCQLLLWATKIWKSRQNHAMLWTRYKNGAPVRMRVLGGSPCVRTTHIIQRRFEWPHEKAEFLLGLWQLHTIQLQPQAGSSTPATLADFSLTCSLFLATSRSFAALRHASCQLRAEAQASAKTKIWNGAKCKQTKSKTFCTKIRAVIWNCSNCNRKVRWVIDGNRTSHTPMAPRTNLLNHPILQNMLGK